MGDEALIGTPEGPSQPTEETAISPFGARPATDPDVLRRQIALDMAIDAKARSAHHGTQSVVELAREYDAFLRGDE